MSEEYMNKLARDDEAQLIARSQQGDIEAFNQLIEGYQQIVYSTVFRILNDYDAAADVTQDAFITAFRAIHTYRGGSSFRAWLLRIGSNTAIDHWRSVQRRRSTSLESLTNDTGPHPSSTLEALTSVGPANNPEEMILTLELQEIIQHGLAQLPIEQRTVIVLYDIQGLSYEEVALATQTTLGTVRSRISRGRAKLRDYLQNYKELLPRNYRLTTSNDG
jgi:RNA polymerase sigma-70 factor, ECF subfamily